MQVNAPLSQKWDLNVIFPGGSESPELDAFLTQLQADIISFRSRIQATAVPQTVEALENWCPLLTEMQELARRARQAGAFIGCLTAQNMKDEKAKLLSGRSRQMFSGFASATTQLDAQILELPDAVFSALVDRPEYQAVTYPLAERRRRAREKMGAEKEALVNDLAVDGNHAWGELYNTIVGRITVPVEVKGDVRQLSVGQAFNKLSDADRNVRATVFERWEKAWNDQSELIGAALNHLSGFRLNLYRHRGWESVLREPLDNNRMTADTLNVMWDVINQNKHHLVKYLNRKAQLLGLEQLTWYDVDAPLSSSTTTVTYDEAAEFIVEQFHKFSPRMADFAKMAFEKSWIEAEDRPGKRPGGFCTSFPVSKESRIFMTFAGTMGNVSTLAHELGHAYHQHVMNDLPQMAQGYAMNVAETASTFAEMIVADAALKAAPSKEERLALLADKIERAVAFFMNIHARFLFETRFYEERKKGLVSIDRLNTLMEEAQKEAYCGALSQYHPIFWASKLHFYSTGQPFYNFPYTFGYLFSSGVYARAMQEGPVFEQKYVDLLRDTGRMMVEDLAARHLGVDLTKPDFWQAAVDLVNADIEEFLALTNK